MNFINRLGFYFIGLSFGIIIMIFILNQKGSRCNYSPQSRVLNDLNCIENVRFIEMINK